MPTMAEVRSKFPMYEDVPDDQLLSALHKKHYSDMPFEQFNASIDRGQKPVGMSPQAQAYRGEYAPAQPNVVEQFVGGAKHAWDRAAAGLEAAIPGGRALSQALSQPDLQQLVQQGGQFVKETGPASTVGQIAGDVAMSAPVALKVFKGLNAARGLKSALAGEAAINAGYGALTADEGNAGQGALTGAAATALGHSLLPAARGLGDIAAGTLGLTTGAGAPAIKQAFKGGADFVTNMRGKVEPGTVVEQARNGLQSMRQTMYDEYAKAKGGWAGDTTQLSLSPIGQAFDTATKKFSFQGMPQPGVEGIQQQVAQVLNHWSTQAQKNPAFATVEGLDALKRHLQDLMPDFNNRTGRAYVTEVVNGVKDTITKQAPQYSKAMKDYWQRSTELDEISRTLSLGDKASIDTALRKLQSVLKPGSTHRAGLAAAIANQGGQDILPAIAGQNLSGWMPRGLQQAVTGGAGSLGVASGVVSPLAAAGGAMVQSPRLVGEAANLAGQAWQKAQAEAIIRALRKGIAPSMAGQPNDNGQ